MLTLRGDLTAGEQDVTKRRLLVTIAVLLGIMVAGAGFSAWRLVAPPEIAAFYDPPSSLETGTPGDIIRFETIASQSENARLWRILYHSTDASGNATAVSALLAAPIAPAPDTGYPLLAVGHGTVGVNRGCAPSIDPYDSFGGGPTAYGLFVGPFVTAGYVVVMSDYQGLGAPGDSSYLIGEIEGRNILDSARAALAFSDISVQPDILIWGQSQGGHAALFAGQLAPTYAPELKVLGVAAEAPAADLGAIFQSLTQRNEQGGVVALPLMAADAWIKAGLDVNRDQLMTKRGEGALTNVVDNVCLMPAILATQLAQPSDLLKPDALDVLGPAITANTPSVGPYAMPLFIGQGDADHVVPVSTNTHFAEWLCEGGNTLTYTVYEGAGHFAIVEAAEADVLAWMERLRSGRDPGTTCGAQ